MMEFLKTLFLILHFLLYINAVLDDVVWNIVIYADYPTFCSEWDQVSDLWQQLKMSSELELILRDTVNPLTCDLNGFKSRVKRHLLSLGSL